MRLVEGVMNGANRGLVGSSGLLWLLVRQAFIIRPLNRRPKEPHAKATGAVTIAFKGSLQLGCISFCRSLAAHACFIYDCARSQPGADDCALTHVAPYRSSRCE